MTELGSAALRARIRERVRDIPDFPQPGVLFKDITPLLADPELFPAIIHGLAEPFRDAGIDQVAGIESRGFLFAAPLALALGAGLVPIRKPGKLPYRTMRVEYELEYGVDSLETHVDGVRPGSRVLVVDDVLATGGTAAAATRLVASLGGEVVGLAFVIELAFLMGRDKLLGQPVSALVTYD
jgi:adenine phosphoribosyltransferase